MVELYMIGAEGHNERGRKDKRNLHDLVRWLEYYKTGCPGVKCSIEQEQYWADQLKEILKDNPKLCKKCGSICSIVPIVPGDDGSKGEHYWCEDCNSYYEMKDKG